MRTSRWHVLSLICIQLLILPGGVAQKKFEYLSPLPNSVLVSRSTNIIVRQGEILEGDLERIASAVNVVGTQSGIHTGRTTMASDGKTIIFAPRSTFTAGERVKVTVGGGIKTQTGGMIGPLEFEFTISPQGLIPAQNISEILRSELGSTQIATVPKMRRGIATQSPTTAQFLPSDFPSITVTVSGATAPGDLFLSNFRFDDGSNTPYLMILNHEGEPVYYQKMSNWCLDFKTQPTGQLSYFDGSAGKFKVMDNSYSVVDSFSTGNGYATDVHEFRLMPNGHGFLFSNDAEPYRMDTIVTGGNPDATVVGLIVQEVDEQKNVVFQWRSWDHFAFTDTYIDLTSPLVDYVHGNALEIDYDGNLLLSSRHMCEITKINKQTGEIMWRLGGKNNQFTFVNDPTGFSYQHAIRRLENGDIVVFDNGNGRDPQYSRAVEYRLDENAKTATLVWQYRNTPDNYGSAMGYVQRLPNTNTLIGWGASNPSVTEVNSTGSKLFEMTFPQGIYSYRAYRLPWKDAVLSTGVDTMNFGEIPFQSESTKEIVVKNLTNVVQTITSLETRDSAFTVLTGTPVDIPASESLLVSVRFQPSHFGSFADVLDIRSDGETRGVVEQVPLIGTSTSPTIDFGAAELDFGNVQRGFVGTQIVRISNASTNGLVIDSIYARNGLFHVSPSHMAVDDTGSLVVTFDPTVEGSFTDVLYFQNNSSEPLVRIPVFASSYGVRITDRELVNFGSDPVQDSVQASVWIHDMFSSPITFFSAVGTNSVIAPEVLFPIIIQSHDSAKVNLRFVPPSVGQYIDTLVLVSDSVGVAILAYGASPPPHLVPNIQSINFGMVPTGTARVSTVEFRDSSLNILRIDSVYTRSRVFTARPPKMPIFLGQSDSLNLDIQFLPEIPGTYTDTLFIMNNSPQSTAKITTVGIGSAITSAEDKNSIPKTFVLGQNYPNPFNPTTTIPFGVPTQSNVRIEVYNILGQSIVKLIDRQFAPGYHSVAWDGHAPSGVYFYTMQAVSTDNSRPDFSKVTKMLLLK